MNKTLNVAVLSVVALATTLGSVNIASARDREYEWRRHEHRHHRGDALAAGALGLAAGAIIGGALASDPGPDVIYESPRRVYVEPDPVYVEPEYVEPEDDYPLPPRREVVTQVGVLEPWTARWRSYCAQRYRSFDARTGTYIGYDGQSHFCTGG